jgi:hypothetical protein
VKPFSFYPNLFSLLFSLPVFRCDYFWRFSFLCEKGKARSGKNWFFQKHAVALGKIAVLWKPAKRFSI